MTLSTLREPVHMLWIGERLSALERLACASFLDHGHPLHLWTYGPVAGVPEGTTVCDATEVLPRSAIFRYGPETGPGAGSLAGFANLFRYRLLLERGGWWADSDVVCLRRPNPLHAAAARRGLDRRRAAATSLLPDSLQRDPGDVRGGSHR